MAVMCIKCRHMHDGNDLPSKCESCGQSNIDMFFRVDKEDFDPESYKKDKEWFSEDDPPQIQSITIGVVRSCPTCGEFPEDFRESFTRRVDENYIIPEKSRTYSESGGKVFCVEDHYAKMQHRCPDEDFSPPDQSPEGLYASVIVPRNLVGKVIRIKVEEAKDADTSPENQDTQEG